jgi:hypothetical protein
MFKTKDYATILTISEYSSIQKNGSVRISNDRYFRWDSKWDECSAQKKQSFSKIINSAPDIGFTSESYIFVIFSYSALHLKKEKNLYIRENDIKFKRALSDRARELLGFSNVEIINEELIKIWKAHIAEQLSEHSFYKALSFIDLISPSAHISGPFDKHNAQTTDLKKLNLNEILHLDKDDNEFQKIQKLLEVSYRTRAYSIRLARWVLTRNLKKQLKDKWKDSNLKKKYFDEVKPLIENYNNIICTAKDGPILKDPLVENYFIKIDDDINVDSSNFKYIFLVTIFHYIHLAEMGIDFSFKSILEDYKILRQFDSECALKAMFMIGRKVTGNQLKDLKQQKNETEFEPLK